MGFTSIWHWLVVLVIVLVLFGGRGKISSIMGDIGKGLKNFKKGMKNEEDESFETDQNPSCLLYTSPSPRDGLLSRMPSSA